MRWLALVAALAAPGAAAADGCMENVVDLRDEDTTARFTVELADTGEERARGLMFRESMPRFSGMLFVYETAQPVAFWMRNTLIPLDMLFFNEQGQLERIKSQAQPRDETPVMGGNDIRFVLEINGGMAEELGIEPGAVLRHPAVDPGIAAWSCDD